MSSIISPFLKGGKIIPVKNVILIAERFTKLTVNENIQDLENHLRCWPRAALLFSGGLDSSLLLAVAARVLGPGLTAITFAGPHIVPGELAAAFELGRRFRVRHLIREIDPLALPEFRDNTTQRCYVCKKAVIQQGWQMAATVGASVLWDGTNLDDLSDFRPGLKAARELGVRSPLLEAGLGKAAIRSLSRALKLDWGKPSQSCLATRFPYGTTLTREALARVGQGEAWLRRLGFSRVRLRVKRRRRPPGTGHGGVASFSGPPGAGPVRGPGGAPGLWPPVPGCARVKIVCTENACRSQMAEGLVNHYLAWQVEAFSAGVAPTPVRTEGEILAAFRRVRDEMRQKLIPFSAR